MESSPDKPLPNVASPGETSAADSSRKESAEDSLERIARLEIALAHHQRDYDVLNSVVTEQAQLIDRMRRQLDLLAERLEVLRHAQATAQPRTLEDDRPPHY